MSVAPNTFKVAPSRRANAPRSVLEVRLDRPVTKDHRVGSRAISYGVAWPFNGVWLVVYGIVNFQRERVRWDWTLGDHFDRTRAREAALVRDRATVSTLQREGPPDVIVSAIRASSKTWAETGVLGVDGVPFTLHLLEDPVARQAAITAYLRENPFTV